MRRRSSASLAIDRQTYIHHDRGVSVNHQPYRKPNEEDYPSPFQADSPQTPFTVPFDGFPCRAQNII